MRRIIWLTLLLLLVVTRSAIAGTPQELVTLGNASYQNAEYQKASEFYLQAIDEGLDSSAVHYNLGNTYYRLEKIGKAIAHYRKALADTPRASDTKANLELARGKVSSPFPSSLATDLTPATTRFLARYRLSSYERRISALIFMLGFSLCLALAVKFNTRLLSKVATLSFVIGLFFILAELTTSEGRSGEPRFAFNSPFSAHAHGVVVNNQANVHSGDSETFQVIFVLNEGVELELGHKRDDWVQVVLPQGRKGWVQLSDIVVI